MMSKAEIQAYRVELEFEMRGHHNDRMVAMNARQYLSMEDHSHAFDRTAAQIDTIDKILKD